MRASTVSQFVLCICATIFIGCGSAKITEEDAPTQTVAPPDIVYVGNFDFGATLVKSDPGTLTGRPRLLEMPKEDETEKLQRFGDLMSNTIMEDLIKGGLPAERLASDATQPTSGWLVAGAFLTLDEGNRLQRTVLGFGVGSSEAKLYVGVADLAHPEGKKLFDFNANSNGDVLPGGGVGAAATHTPWGAVAKYVIEKNPSEKDIQNDAHAIAKRILKYAGKS
jgi:hypothetical protein